MMPLARGSALLPAGRDPIARLVLLGLAAAMIGAAPAAAEQPRRAYLTTSEMFVLAEASLRKGDSRSAEAAYRALTKDADSKIRAEARFRLGKMLVGLGRPTEAGLLFRQILDEQPSAQPVRIELAQVLDLIGDEAGARRALREAQAGGLPPDVARLVDRYSAALRARRPFGAAIELALASDSNVNHATQSDTLGTILGDFTLDEDAKQRSGVGAAIRGQAYWRKRVSDKANLLVRSSASADLYKDKAFNDLSVSATAGPELRLGPARVAAELGLTRRWFGGAPFSTTASLELNHLQPLSKTSQLRAKAALGLIDNHRNRLQDGRSYSLTVSYERALSSHTGVGASVAAERQYLRDPGYSMKTGQLTLFGYRDLGPMTLVGTLAYGRLEADERLLLYPRARRDQLYRASLAVTFRQLTVGQFAPLIRVTAERNQSSLELYQYRRMRTEFGIARAF